MKEYLYNSDLSNMPGLQLQYNQCGCGALPFCTGRKTLLIPFQRQVHCMCLLARTRSRGTRTPSSLEKVPWSSAEHAALMGDGWRAIRWTSVSTAKSLVLFICLYLLWLWLHGPKDRPSIVRCTIHVYVKSEATNIVKRVGRVRLCARIVILSNLLRFYFGALAVYRSYTETKPWIVLAARRPVQIEVSALSSLWVFYIGINGLGAGEWIGEPHATGACGSVKGRAGRGGDARCRALKSNLLWILLSA